MSNKRDYTFSDLERWLNEHRVTEIECLVPDLTGVARGKILPREKFTEDRGMRLPEAIVGIGVTGTFTDTSAIMNGTALVGKASQIFRATLRKLADTE